MKPFLFALCVCNLSLASPILAQDQPDTVPLQPTAARQYESVEERRLMESLQAPDSGPLAQERAELEKRKMELKVLENEVDKKIAELNQLRQQVEDLLAEKEAEELKRIEELARVYERMTGEKAALILATIDEELAVAIFAAMKTKSAALILNNMERGKAASLTSAFSTLDNR